MKHYKNNLDVVICPSFKIFPFPLLARCIVSLDCSEKKTLHDFMIKSILRRTKAIICHLVVEFYFVQFTLTTDNDSICHIQWF